MIHSLRSFNLRQVHSLFHIVFSTECDLVLRLSICSVLVFPLKSSINCLRLLPRLSVTSSIFPSITCFRRQFLRKMWPTQLAFLLFIVCTTFLSSLTHSNTTSFLTRSVLLQRHISKLYRHCYSTFTKVSKFQRHTRLCSKCITLLVSSLYRVVPKVMSNNFL